MRRMQVRRLFFIQVARTYTTQGKFA